MTTEYPEHWTIAIRGVLRREGWPAPARAHRADPGGLTRGGITATNWTHHARLDHPATAGELDAINEHDALNFYAEAYVRRLGLEVVHEPLFSLLLDWAVTSWNNPVRTLQRELARRGLYAGRLDGVMGPQSREALRLDDNPQETYRAVFRARVQFYTNLAIRQSVVLRFLRAHPDALLHNLQGWTARALEFAP